jgi:RHS repeat-associated protein
MGFKKNRVIYYSYKFTGKERDEETGLDYFGARYYDSDLSLWLSVDPMAHKYPSWSPYAAFFNNPIYYIDPDGKEGIGAVDHKNKTITIKAVYFTEIGKSGFNKENLNQLQGLNATLNSQNYTITDETNSLHGYAVQFDLQFAPVNAAEKAQQFAVSEQQLTANNATGGTNLIEGGFNIGNSLILTDDPSFEAIPSIKETAEKNKVGADKVLGITDASLQHINIPQKSQGNAKTALHEIFHTLYFDKDGAKTGIGSGKELPNQSDINNLIKGVQDQGRIVE